MAAQSAHPVLKDEPRLRDIQNYIKDVVKARGFDDNTVQDNFIMLTEEVGELAKALRSLRGIGLADDSTAVHIEHEVADVLWMLICVCNQLDIDLEAALRAKEEKNKQRTWR